MVSAPASTAPCSWRSSRSSSPASWSGARPSCSASRWAGARSPLTALALLVMPALVLVFTGIGMVAPLVSSQMLALGPHGLTEVMYAYASAANNNGSAFAGFSADTPYTNLTLALCMLLGRFVPIVLVLALAGSLVAQRRRPGQRRHAADPHTHVHRPLRRGGAHRHRTHLLPGPGPRSPRGGTVMTLATLARQLVATFPQAVRKLDPRHVVRSPVVFVVWVGSLLTTVVAVVDPSWFALEHHPVAVGHRPLRQHGRGRRRGPRQGPGGHAARRPHDDDGAAPAGRRLPRDGRGAPT